MELQVHDPSTAYFAGHGVVTDRLAAELAGHGFHCVGGLRIWTTADPAELGPRAAAAAERGRSGEDMEEVWAEVGGQALIFVCALDGPVFCLRTVLEDSTLIQTDTLDQQLIADLCGGRVVEPNPFGDWPKGGSYLGHVPGASVGALIEAHRVRVLEASEAEGSAVVPVRTLDDAVLLIRLTMRRISQRGIAAMMEQVGPTAIFDLGLLRFGLFLVVLQLVWSAARLGQVESWMLARSAALVVLVCAVWWTMRQLSRFLEERSWREELSLAELRRLPTEPTTREGAVGLWAVPEPRLWG